MTHYILQIRSPKSLNNHFNLSQSRFLEIFPPILKNVMNEILLPHTEYFCQKFSKTREFMWFHVSIWKYLF